MTSSVLGATTVIDLSQAISGPLCSRNLSAMGARVIKIERPGIGDLNRYMDDIVNGESSGHVWVNTAKESICVDLTVAEGQEVVRRLLRLPNPVMLHNFVPGHVERWGLDYPTLKSAFPGLIYASISGYGPTGPYARREAVDIIVQGESGILLTNGTKETYARISLPVCDIAAASYATMGILEAIIHRERTGEGQEIFVSLFETVLSWSAYYPYLAWYRGETPPRNAVSHPTVAPPYGAFTGSDGREILLTGLGARGWPRLCEAIERRELVEDPRYATPAARRERREELQELFAREIRKRPAEEWVTRFSHARVPCGLVRDLREALMHPQLEAAQAISEVDSKAGPVKILNFPVHSTVAEHSLRKGPPARGEHSRSILAELGYVDSEVVRLQAAGTVELRAEE